MTDAPLTPAEEDAILAGEYVLGVLDLADRSATEARIKADSDFAARVVAWENRLAGLNGEFAEAPAPDLMPKIEARLFPTSPRAPRRSPFGWLSGAAVAAVVTLAVVMVVAPPEPEVIAVMRSEPAGVAYALGQFGDRLTVTRVGGAAAPEGQVHELWIIAPGAAPVSVGLLADSPLVVAYPVPPEGGLFAVSVEPAGGSPRGLPSGPVILSALIGAEA